MNYRLSIALLAAFVLLVACSGADTPAEPLDPNSGISATSDPNAPISSDDPAQPTEDPFADPNMVEGTLYVNSVELLTLESFPLQMIAIVKGDFSDGCTQMAGSEQTIDGNTITVTLKGARPADVACTEALVPFEENVGVDIFGLAAGDYTVVVKGVNDVTATFTLDMDNILPE